MKTQTIDGKRYFRYEIHDWIARVSALAFIVVLIFIFLYINRNLDELKADPILYGMEKHNFSECQCLAEDGKRWTANKTEIYTFLDWQQPKLSLPYLNVSS